MAPMGPYGNDLSSHGNDFLSRGNDLLSLRNDLLSRGNDFLFIFTMSSKGLRSIPTAMLNTR